MILVTGATGTIGSEVVRQLAARGQKVRALTRDPAAARVPSGVEAVPGHHRDRDSVQAAMAGVEAAFLVGVFGPDDAQHDRGLVEAARAAGVPRIVKLSSIGTGDPRLAEFGNWHLPGEEAVRASGLEWTVLRPSSFASNTLAWAEAVYAGTAAPNLMSDGAQGVVDPRDVSEVAVSALLDPRHAGRTYTLTGPETIRASDQAAVLGEILDRPVELLQLTADQRRELLLGAGLGAAYADSLVASARFIEEGGNAVVTDDVPQVLRRPARSFREWALDHRAAFMEG
ncbi:NAD-dependent epimerase/dehydratase family protein [Streptomyces sp. uw30]|uniref:NAD(P)H-binding protein n=1 Tax=Streptomyces sp. uw30 TaxID=1828179 RepID=UPI0011CD606D|nr:NAD-dependent epimerase/dehydratase family protein [Streptomyces sp. uw30]